MQPAVGKHVIIMGMGPGRTIARSLKVEEPDALVWGINLANLSDGVDLIINIHNWPEQIDTWEEKLRDKKKRRYMASFRKAQRDGVDILACKAWKRFPAIKPYPIQEVIDHFKIDYFTSGVAYALALAIYQGAAKITMCGITGTEQVDIQRPCIEFWMGVAHGRGVEIVSTGPGVLLIRTEPAETAPVLSQLKYGYDMGKVRGKRKTSVAEVDDPVTRQPIVLPPLRKHTPAPPNYPGIIVTGFARTGTTAMMRMLHAGGIPLIAEEASAQDHGAYHADGIYEIENVLSAVEHHPKNWTNGRALKVVTPYLPALPLDRRYRMIFMLRDTREIITSVLACMTIWEEDPVTSIGNARKFLGENNIKYLDVQYNDMIKYPRATAIQVAEFLEWHEELDIDAMAKIADPAAREKAFEKHGHKEELLTFDKGRMEKRVAV